MEKVEIEISPAGRYYLRGNGTYAIKEQLKAAGCIWDANVRAWFTADRAVAERFGVLPELIQAPKPDLRTLADLTAKRHMAGAAEWWTVTRGRSVIASLTGRWCAQHEERLRALAEGRALPAAAPVVDPGAALRELEHGRDVTQHIDSMTRYLARHEAEQAGALLQALQACAAEQWPAAVREVFGSLYDEPGEAVVPLGAGAGWVESLLGKAATSPDWEQLAGMTRGDAWAAGVATGEILQRLAQDLDLGTRANQLPNAQQLVEDAEATAELVGDDHELAQAARAAVQEAVEKATELQVWVEGRADEALAEALAEAIEAIEVTKLGATAIGGGAGMPQLVAGTPAEIRQALAANPALRRIAEIAGRMRISARRVKRTKTRYVPEQIVDVTVGGELARLLPSELVRLAEPATELDLARRLIEHQALQYELEGTEALERGPVIVAVDASGSMQGARYEWAMGVTLALVERAILDRRPFRFFAFDVRPSKVHSFESFRDVTLAALDEMLTRSFTGGGTDIGRVVSQVETMVDGVYREADLVLVSDGESEDFSADLVQLRERHGVRTYGVSIESEFRPLEQAEMAGCVLITDQQLKNGTANADMVLAV